MYVSMLILHNQNLMMFSFSPSLIYASSWNLVGWKFFFPSISVVVSPSHAMRDERLIAFRVLGKRAAPWKIRQHKKQNSSEILFFRWAFACVTQSSTRELENNIINLILSLYFFCAVWSFRWWPELAFSRLSIAGFAILFYYSTLEYFDYLYDSSLGY